MIVESRGIKPGRVETFENVPGLGIKAKVDGAQILIGSAGWLQDLKINIESLAKHAAPLAEQGKTPVFVASINRLLVTIYPSARFD